MLILKTQWKQKTKILLATKVSDFFHIMKYSKRYEKKPIDLIIV